MNSIKALSILTVSLFSLNVFAVTDREVVTKAAKAIEKAAILSTEAGVNCHGGFVNKEKFYYELRGNKATVIERQDDGRSYEGPDVYNETYAGAVIINAKEAYSSSINIVDGIATSQVLGFELQITCSYGTITKTMGKLSVYTSKSNKMAIVSEFIAQK